MSFLPAVLLYSIMALLAGVVAVKSYQRAIEKNNKGLKNFSIFFAFLTLYLLSFLILVIFAIRSDSIFISIGFIFSRNLILLAIIFLFQTSVFQHYKFFRTNKDYITAALIICVFLFTIISILNFNRVEVTLNSLVIFNLHILAAFILILVDIFTALSWAGALFLEKSSRANKDIQLKIYFLSIGGIFLGIGDSVFISSLTAMQALLGSLLSLTGYAAILTIVIISHLKRHQALSASA